MKNLHLFLFLTSLFISCKEDKIVADFVIANVNIIDVENGTIESNKWIAIEGSKIEAIYDHEIPLASSVEIIDGTGKYLMPGLWDIHAHYSYSHNYANQLLFANGVNGVRDMWGTMDTISSIGQKSIKRNFSPRRLYIGSYY
ncbi:hypothetical protein [Maribacter halichondriae]|uniref:hypothetical protein n=1 Tax=Maribacter halichondriae TaxID=2980554 RepID=UPI0023594FC9|nr:hypothetical protein [Maribacter sp. Hal144]